jgi:hypothetical protein
MKVRRFHPVDLSVILHKGGELGVGFRDHPNFLLVARSFVRPVSIDISAQATDESDVRVRWLYYDAGWD